jgi:asparagine synthase (glutamine-hydrolysing)
VFAGVLCLGEELVAARVLGGTDLLSFLCPGDRPDVVGTLSEGPLVLVQAKFCGARSDAERRRGWPLPHRCRVSGRVVAFWGRLDNRAQLECELDLGAGSTDEELVLAAFARWGPDCAERLEGDLAAAVVEPEARRLWLVRDRLGVKPLYYWSAHDSLMFATSAAVRVGVRGVSQGVDRAWIARELADIPHEQAATPWSDVARLPPGHWLELTGRARRLRRYHVWRDDPPWATMRDPRWVEAYRTVLEEAVVCRMRGTELIASESSGGLDSATVTSYLASLLGEHRGRLCAFGFADAELEGEYIAATSVHAGVACTSLLTRQDRNDAILRSLAAVGYPALGNAAAFIPVYEECRRRAIRTLFSGFGGDDTVTNTGALLGRELRDRHAYRALYETLRGGPAARFARLVRAVAYGQRWGAGHPTLQQVMAERWPHLLVRADVAAELRLHELYQARAAFDRPYRRINDFVLHRLGSHVSSRLETCTLVAATYGVDYRWPLLEPRLVQQWLSTPSIEKANRAFGRYLHRRAVDGVVAPKVAWNPTKDMGALMRPAAAGLGHGVDRRDIARDARRQRADLHPVLAEVVDTRRLNAQIATAGAGFDDAAQFQFRRNVRHLRWMNQWLWQT